MRCAPHPSTGRPPLVRSFASTTLVTFDCLPPEAIQAYVESGEPFGKAGSYGIQGAAGAFVVGLQGCYFNVMGFPLHRFCAELAALIAEGRLQL
ncbi:Maf-like protein [Tetrabaena socialis]|uniref:Maf-like protein n=1 Tax=Tetrabaena socialis TaxID=47790 RepID=A0A2J8ABS4_9CHLO|nr:Maf-like protein [Tetrabaena socialis]|eukprot:PNH09971.1 Maf-like protein [Tetrabaena socialis]